MDRASDSSKLEKLENLAHQLYTRAAFELDKMRPPALPVSSLRTWAKFNGISFKDISVEKNKEYGGYGVISTTTISDSAGDEGSSLTVLNVPNDLILSAETIAEHAKIDKHFGQILEAVGGNVRVHLIDHVERIANSNIVVTWGCNAILADASDKSFIRPKC
jgi:hypothetical protein